MRLATAVGFGVSVSGAALDFYVGASLGVQAGMTAGDRLVGIAFVILGLAVLGLGIALLLPRMGSRRGRLGLGMELCGIAMAVASAWSPGMSLLLSFAMLSVGGLMILSGALMQRSGRLAAPRV